MVRAHMAQERIDDPVPMRLAASTSVPTSA